MERGTATCNVARSEHGHTACATGSAAAPENLGKHAIEIRHVRPVVEVWESRSPDDAIDLLLGTLEDFGVQNHGEHEIRGHRDGLEARSAESPRIIIECPRTVSVPAGDSVRIKRDVCMRGRGTYLHRSPQRPP